MCLLLFDIFVAMYLEFQSIRGFGFHTQLLKHHYLMLGGKALDIQVLFFVGFRTTACYIFRNLGQHYCL